MQRNSPKKEIIYHPHIDEENGPRYNPLDYQNNEPYKPKPLPPYRNEDIIPKHNPNPPPEYKARDYKILNEVPKPYQNNEFENPPQNYNPNPQRKQSPHDFPMIPREVQPLLKKIPEEVKQQPQEEEDELHEDNMIKLCCLCSNSLEKEDEQKLECGHASHTFCVFR